MSNQAGLYESANRIEVLDKREPFVVETDDLLCLSDVGFRKASSAADSIFRLATSGSGYHGFVAEDQTRVNVTPPIKVAPGNNELVCGFSIINHKKRHDEIPFEVRRLDDLLFTF